MAIASQATIKFNFRSNSPEELAKLRTKIFDAIEEACREETEKWGKDEITWDKNLISQVPGRNSGFPYTTGRIRVAWFEVSGY